MYLQFRRFAQSEAIYGQGPWALRVKRLDDCFRYLAKLKEECTAKVHCLNLEPIGLQVAPLERGPLLH